MKLLKVIANSKTEIISILLGLVSILIAIGTTTYKFTIKAEADKNILQLYDRAGRIKIKSFESNITKVILDEVNNNYGNEIFIGFEAFGEDKNYIIALGTRGKQLWEYELSGENCNKKRFNPEALETKDICCFTWNDSVKIAVLMSDYTWATSVLLILSSKGIIEKEFWHPGRLVKITYHNKRFILYGVNNEFSEIYTKPDSCEYYWVIFCLDYGKMAKIDELKWNKECDSINQSIDWYNVAMPPGEDIGILNIMNNRYTFWINSLRFTVDQNDSITNIDKAYCWKPTDSVWLERRTHKKSIFLN